MGPRAALKVAAYDESAPHRLLFFRNFSALFVSKTVGVLVGWSCSQLLIGLLFLVILGNEKHIISPDVIHTDHLRLLSPINQLIAYFTVWVVLLLFSGVLAVWSHKRFLRATRRLLHSLEEDAEERLEEQLEHPETYNEEEEEGAELRLSLDGESLLNPLREELMEAIEEEEEFQLLQAVSLAPERSPKCNHSRSSKCSESEASISASVFLQEEPRLLVNRHLLKYIFWQVLSLSTIGVPAWAIPDVVLASYFVIVDILGHPYFPEHFNDWAPAILALLYLCVSSACIVLIHRGFLSQHDPLEVESEMHQPLEHQLGQPLEDGKMEDGKSEYKGFHIFDSLEDEKSPLLKDEEIEHNLHPDPIKNDPSDENFHFETPDPLTTPDPFATPDPPENNEPEHEPSALLQRLSSTIKQKAKANTKKPPKTLRAFISDNIFLTLGVAVGIAIDIFIDHLFADFMASSIFLQILNAVLMTLIVTVIQWKFFDVSEVPKMSKSFAVQMKRFLNVSLSFVAAWSIRDAVIDIKEVFVAPTAYVDLSQLPTLLPSQLPNGMSQIQETLMPLVTVSGPIVASSKISSLDAVPPLLPNSVPMPAGPLYFSFLHLPIIGELAIAVMCMLIFGTVVGLLTAWQDRARREYRMFKYRSHVIKVITLACGTVMGWSWACFISTLYQQAITNWIVEEKPWMAASALIIFVVITVNVCCVASMFVIYFEEKLEEMYEGRESHGLFDLETRIRAGVGDPYTHHI